MKKYLLSGAFVILFVIYALYQRSQINAKQSVAVSTAPTSTIFTQSSPITGTANPASTSTAAGSAPLPSSTGLKDGSYSGAVANTYYGDVQVKAVISGGKIANVIFLTYPKDRGESKQINTAAAPKLTREAITAQSAKVDVVSGATQTSEGFTESLKSALAQA